jgi:hypothetical protein
MDGNITRKLPVKLPLCQTSKSVIVFFFYLFSFLSTELENSRVEQVLQGRWGGVGAAPVGGGRGGKEGRRVNAVQKMCTQAGPVILATQKAEIRRTMVESQPEQRVRNTLS